MASQQELISGLWEVSAGDSFQLDYNGFYSYDIGNEIYNELTAEGISQKQVQFLLRFINDQLELTAIEIVPYDFNNFNTYNMMEIDGLQFFSESGPVVERRKELDVDDFVLYDNELQFLVKYNFDTNKIDEPNSKTEKYTMILYDDYTADVVLESLLSSRKNPSYGYQKITFKMDKIEEYQVEEIEEVPDSLELSGTSLMEENNQDNDLSTGNL